TSPRPHRQSSRTCVPNWRRTDPSLARTRRSTGGVLLLSLWHPAAHPLRRRT
ncbi:unnamed protein product, partial [Symbiodinium pilosum]